MIKKSLNDKTLDCDFNFRSLCEFDGCVLNDFCTKKIARKSMIRKFCLNDCMNSSRVEVRLCSNGSCPFCEYRMGNNTKFNRK